MDQIAKQEFAKRLADLMTTKKWTQSDLARAAFGTMESVDKKGRRYIVARRRDSISSYLRGRTYPDPHSLDALAKALGVDQNELLPMDVETPALHIEQVGDSDRVWLRVNQKCTLEQAIKIAQILTK